MPRAGLCHRLVGVFMEKVKVKQALRVPGDSCSQMSRAST